jgi:homoserine dehydrogenase
MVAQAFNNFNAIILEGLNCGELGFYGQGAGASPTATAMFDDLVSLFPCCSHSDVYAYETLPAHKVSDLPSRYYFRFTVKNEAGILSRISGILASLGVNIDRIIQKVENNAGIELVLLTSCLDKALFDQLIQINRKEGLEISAVYPVVD